MSDKIDMTPEIKDYLLHKLATLFFSFHLFLTKSGHRMDTKKDSSKH